VGQLLETCISPSPGIRGILRVDIYDLLKNQILGLDIFMVIEKLNTQFSYTTLVLIFFEKVK
jgi:hypothetical protein